MHLAKWMGGEIQVQLIQFVTEWQLTMGWHSNQSDRRWWWRWRRGRREKKCLACDKTHFHLPPSLFSILCHLLLLLPSVRMGASMTQIYKEIRERERLHLNKCVFVSSSFVSCSSAPFSLRWLKWHHTNNKEHMRDFARLLSLLPTERPTDRHTQPRWLIE